MLAVIIGSTILLIGIIILIIKVINKKSEEGITSLMFSSGISLVIAASPDLLDKLILFTGIIKNYQNQEIIKSEFNIYYFILGTILIISSIVTNLLSKQKLYILNINGYNKYPLENYLEKMKISIYNFKERELNFINIYKQIFKKQLNKESCYCILQQIEEEVKAFKNETKGLKKGYTGIASIPFIIYAGTFLDRYKVDRYFEYDKVETKDYYELSHNNKVSYPQLKLKTDTNSLDNNKKEITLVISTTQTINDGVLQQFSERSNIVRLEVDNPIDNTIVSIIQLNKYVEFIFATIVDLTSKLDSINVINLVIAAQSCLALEIGKRCVDDTRIPKIISYQFENQCEVKYPWGIVINGPLKGDLIKE